jgi:hypothetical protein
MREGSVPPYLFSQRMIDVVTIYEVFSIISLYGTSMDYNELVSKFPSKKEGREFISNMKKKKFIDYDYNWRNERMVRIEEKGMEKISEMRRGVRILGE